MAQDQLIPLKVAGALSGVVYVGSFDSTVGQLRHEIARLAGNENTSGTKIIVGGRTLQDDTRTLTAERITPSSRLLVMMGANAASGGIAAEGERAQRRDALWRAAEKLAGRGDGQGLGDEQELRVENQSGALLKFSPEDRRSLVMGLTLHERGRASMKKADYAAALEVLLLAEEALNLADPKMMEGVDNLGLLLLDIVWVCYLLNDVRRLAICRNRLARARTILTTAFGPNLERVRNLAGGGGGCPESATLLRLEALEGVVLYHACEYDAARTALEAAAAKWRSLQISDESLAMLIGMGFSRLEAGRALRFSGGDIARAADWAAVQREEKEKRKAKRRVANEWLSVRKRYGRTKSSKYVDQEAVSMLEKMGYARDLAAMALKRADNNGYDALELLADSTTQTSLLLELAMLDAGLRPPQCSAAGSSEQQQQRSQQSASEQAGTSSEQPAADGGSAVATTSAAAADVGSGSGAEAAPGEARQEAAEEEAYDPVEDELVSLVRTGDDDPLAAYDLDVSMEGEMVEKYLALLASQKTGS